MIKKLFLDDHLITMLKITTKLIESVLRMLKSIYKKRTFVVLNIQKEDIGEINKWKKQCRFQEFCRNNSRVWIYKRL